MVCFAHQSSKEFFSRWVPDTKPIRRWKRASRPRKFLVYRAFQSGRTRLSTNATVRGAPSRRVHPDFSAAAPLHASLPRPLLDRSLAILSRWKGGGSLDRARNPVVIALPLRPLHQNAANNSSTRDRR